MSTYERALQRWQTWAIQQPEGTDLLKAFEKVLDAESAMGQLKNAIVAYEDLDNRQVAEQARKRMEEHRMATAQIAVWLVHPLDDRERSRSEAFIHECKVCPDWDDSIHSPWQNTYREWKVTQIPGHPEWIGWIRETVPMEQWTWRMYKRVGEYKTEVVMTHTAMTAGDVWGYLDDSHRYIRPLDFMKARSEIVLAMRDLEVVD